MRVLEIIFTTIIICSTGFVLGTLLSCGVDRPSCTVIDEMRCNNDVIEVCTEEKVWFDETDCGNVTDLDGNKIILQCCLDDNDFPYCTMHCG